MYSVTLNVVVYVQRKSSELNIFSSICNFFFLSCLMAAVNVSYNSTDIAGTLTERTDSSEEQTKVVEQMVMKITDKAAKSLENTTYTKEEALVLEREIEEALNSTQSKQGTTWFNVDSASVGERSQRSFPNP